MSGHSKWSTIKHRKAAQDAKRGKTFTKLIRELTTAVRAGGEDVKANPRLRLAMLQARSHNMPNDTVQRAIKKGLGSNTSNEYEEAIYEGYAPEKVAVMVATLTDNRNRTAAAIRHLFGKFGGHLGGANSVRHLFVRRGTLQVETTDEERLTNTAIEAGAEDLEDQSGQYQVLCAVDTLEKVRSHLEKNGFQVIEPALEWLPISPVTVKQENSIKQILKLLDSLEEHEDVQQVFSSLELSDEDCEKYAQ